MQSPKNGTIVKTVGSVAFLYLLGNQLLSFSQTALDFTAEVLILLEDEQKRVSCCPWHLKSKMSRETKAKFNNN